VRLEWRGPLTCAILGLVSAASPTSGYAAIKLELARNTSINVQPNEVIKARNDANLADFASTDRPPLRITDARYNGARLFTDQLCVTMPNLGSDLRR